MSVPSDTTPTRAARSYLSAYASARSSIGMHIGSIIVYV